MRATACSATPDSKTYLYGWNHIYANGINGVYTQGQLWIGKAADSANGDETTAVYNNAADGVHTDGGTVQGDHLNCYGNSYSGISAMKNESLDQTATLELTAPVTSHENGHSGLYLKGGTKATVSGGSFTENGAEHAEIYAGSGTDTTLKDGVEVKTSADKTLQNSGLRIAVMLDGVDVFRTDSTLQIPAGDSIHLKQDADVVTWNGGTREQLGVTCENPWLGRTIIQSDTAVLDWENSRESNNAQTAEQHPENGIDTNVYYTAIEDAYFGMKNSDAHDVWLSYKSNYRYYYNHDAAAGTALTVDGIDSGGTAGHSAQVLRHHGGCDGTDRCGRYRALLHLFSECRAQRRRADPLLCGLAAGRQNLRGRRDDTARRRSLAGYYDKRRRRQHFGQLWQPQNRNSGACRSFVLCGLAGCHDLRSGRRNAERRAERLFRNQAQRPGVTPCRPNRRRRATASLAGRPRRVGTAKPP